MIKPSKARTAISVILTDVRQVLLLSRIHDWNVIDDDVERLGALPKLFQL